MASRESNPLVEVSSAVPGIFYNPLSTLIPETIPNFLSPSMKVVPSLYACLDAVSENIITPETYCSIPGVVNNKSLYACLFSALFSTLIVTNFFPIVPSDSSAARIPLPGVQIALAVAASSYLNVSTIFLIDICL